MARLRVNARQPSPSQSRDSTESSSQLGSTDGPPLPDCDLFNTTFSLYRASPLFIGESQLTDLHLRALELQLRDILTGDFVRGIEVGLDDDSDRAVGNAGALEAVAIEWVSAHHAVTTPRPGLQVTLQYENAQCIALLLPLPDESESPNGTSVGARRAFIHLPLLLLRMPTHLRDTIVGFLSASFDCRISALHLTDDNMIRGWESWVSATSLPTTETLTKDAVMTLAFSLPETSGMAGTAEDEGDMDTSTPVSDTPPGPSPLDDATGASLPDAAGLGLKTIDIFLTNDDLRKFFKAGQLPGSAHGVSSTPLTSALAAYVKKHLGIDMANPAVSVVRVACGGFVLSNSRLKIFELPNDPADIAFGRRGGLIPLILGDLMLRATG